MVSTGSSLIAGVFMAKLLAAELYGAPAEGLAERLAERAPKGVTEEGLNAAAERIIRQRGSGAFPKFPECLAAIEATHARFQPRAVTRGVAGIGVTKETFHEAARAHGARMGYDPKGGWPVIDRDKDPDAWREWQRYFAHLGMKASEAALKFEATKRWTVPAHWPHEFDLAAPSAHIEVRAA